jgi:hypothetical protein
METFIVVIIVAVILVLVFLPLLYYTRRSSDVRLEGEMLVIRYPIQKKEINLKTDLKSWNMQEAKFLWIGKVYAINLELNSGKWHNVNSRFNSESFNKVFEFLEKNFKDKRKKDLK